MLAPCEVLNFVRVVVVVVVIIIIIIIIIIVICKAAYVLILISRSIHNRAQQVKISTV